MPPKKKTKRANSTGKPQQQFVFVLTRVEYNHAADIEPEVMGIYASKEIAARVSGSLDTYSTGTFDEALAEYQNNYCSFVLDNRRNPPDDGILLQAGNEDEGEGDHIVLKINKMPVVAETTLEIKPIPKRDNADDDASNLVYM